jgi:hypothetical protein
VESTFLISVVDEMQVKMNEEQQWFKAMQNHHWLETNQEQIL